MHELRKIIDVVDNLTEDANLYEMTNLVRSITGINPVVFCSPKGNASHECRVKVSNVPGKIAASDVFSIDLKDLEVIGHCKLSQSELDAVKWWIHQNRFIILDFWKERIDTREFINGIKPITLKEGTGSEE